jgi:putative transposase
MLRLMKANSSKWINEVKKPKKAFEWQPGYAAFSVSESQVGTVEAYISNQREHHQTRTFEEEFLLFLKKHNIQFDPHYVFEQEVIQ